MLGHKDQRTLTSWRSRGVPVTNPVPAPDGHRIEQGHARPVWRLSTVRSYLDSRPGKGNRAPSS